MAETLGEITVTGQYNGWSSWNDCFFELSGGPGGGSASQSYAFALHWFLNSDGPWIDLHSAMLNSTDEQCKKLLRHAASMWDYLGPWAQKDVNAALYSASATQPFLTVVHPLQANSWSIMKAAANFLFGNGAQMYMSIHDVMYPFTNPARIGQGTPGSLLAFAETHQVPGSYNYHSGVYGYQTYDGGSWPAQLIVGGISVETFGTFTRHANGTWSLNATTTAFPDVFDMDARRSRPEWAEQITAMFRRIGGTPFTIVITDALPTNLTGN